MGDVPVSELRENLPHRGAGLVNKLGHLATSRQPRTRVLPGFHGSDDGAGPNRVNQNY